MKPPLQLPFCALQSIIYTRERRIMIFISKASRPDPAPKEIHRRPLAFQLKLRLEPEALFSFEPVIQVRSQTKP